MYFLSQTKNNISILELHHLAGLSYPTVWRMKHKLVQIMYERKNSTRLSGRAEVDDAYLGGENSGGKTDRGYENKVPFIAAVQTNDKHNPLYVVFSKVKTFSNTEVKAWANRSLVPATTWSPIDYGASSQSLSPDASNNVRLSAKAEKAQTWNTFPGSIPSLAT